GKFVDISAAEVEKERSFLAGRPAEIRAVVLRIVSRQRPRSLKWIARVKRIRVAVDQKLPVIFVRAGLGENFNTTKSKMIVFRRKGILVNSNLANRGFWRKLTSGEAININLSTIGARRRSGKRLQFVLQFIGIVGKRIEVFPFQNNGTCVVCSSDI